MNKTLEHIIAATGIVITLVLLLFSLLLGYVYFTVYDPQTFTNGVSASIDEAKLQEALDDELQIVSETYGFDNTVVSEVMRDVELKVLAENYFTTYYNAYISGDELPEFYYENDAILEAVNENIDSAKRPELYEIVQNREKLAKSYEECVSTVIASLSINKLYTAALTLHDKYVEFTSLGFCFKYVAIACVIFLALTVTFTVWKRKRTAAYVASLLSFCVTLFMSVPFAYLAWLKLPARLNVSIGHSAVYIDAVYDFLVTRASHTFTTISIAAFILFVISAVARVNERDKAEHTTALK